MLDRPVNRLPGKTPHAPLAGKVLAGLLFLSVHSLAAAQEGAQLPLLIGTGPSGTSFSVPVQTLLFFTALSFLPAVLLTMT